MAFPQNPVIPGFAAVVSFYTYIYEKIKDEDKYLYFKDGRQKKKHMKCHDPQ